MLDEGRSLAIKGKWVLVSDNNSMVIKENQYVYISGNVIEAITPDKPTGDIEVMEYEDALIMPGFLNIHSHCINGAMFRGIPDDARFEHPWLSRLIYELLLPMADLTLSTLSSEEVSSLVTLGMLDVLKGGTTTLVDQWNIKQEVFFDVARMLGTRVYGAPTIMSASKVHIRDDGSPQIEFNRNEMGMLEQVIALHKRHDGTSNDRIRVMLGPHAPDTCAPDLLHAVRSTAQDLGCPITIHLAQTEDELAVVASRYNMTPVEYLDSVKLLGPDLIAAHCVYATDKDLDIIQARQSTVANCVVSFARAGINVPLSRTTMRGIRTGIGTDSHGMNMISELRTAGFFSKLHCSNPQVASAYDLVHAATTAGAQGLGRNDLGRLAPNCKADLLVIDMAKPHLQPVWDPVKNLIWKGSSSDIAAIVIDGQIVVADGVSTMVDEAAVIKQASEAVHKVWDMAESRGVLNRAITNGAPRIWRSQE